MGKRRNSKTENAAEKKKETKLREEKKLSVAVKGAWIPVE